VPGKLPVVFIMGPTASGKTAVAMEQVCRTSANIVSVDSAMIYRQMNIGTAKPTTEELHRAPHALIDILDPAQSWSVGEFCSAANAEIIRCHSQGRIPLLTGGTMMYFRALEHGLNELPAADPDIRRDIDAKAEESGWPAVHAELAKFDVKAAHRIHENDAQRIQRAVEVFRITGTPLSVLQSKKTNPFAYPLVKCALEIEDRAELHKRINNRFDLMMKSGFLEEVAALYSRGDLYPDLPSIRSVGYRQLWSHLDGQASLSEATEKAKASTRQLAKRQLTWLRGDTDLVSLIASSSQTASKLDVIIQKRTLAYDHFEARFRPGLFQVINQKF